jgi:hypothetical protein
MPIVLICVRLVHASTLLSAIRTAAVCAKPGRML